MKATLTIKCRYWFLGQCLAHNASMFCPYISRLGMCLKPIPKENDHESNTND